MTATEKSALSVAVSMKTAMTRERSAKMTEKTSDTPIGRFHAHLDECHRCRTQPFNQVRA